MKQDAERFEVVIRTSDACKICKMSVRTAQRVLAAIRKNFEKDPKHYVTIDEFSDFTGIPVELILRKLNS